MPRVNVTLGIIIGDLAVLLIYQCIFICYKAIVGYACYIEGIGGGEEGSSPNACYLMRIGVRTKCQRQGIGRKLMAFLLEKYSKGFMSLDVNAENEKAIRFYRGLGLNECETYRVMDKQAFIKF